VRSINILLQLTLMFTKTGFANDRKKRNWVVMKKNLTIIPILAFIFLPNAALAASSDWVLSGDSRMRLVVAEPQAGTKIIRAALEVELAPGWKTYWQDPGEAGVPLQVDISTSQNLTLKAINFPAPMRFDDGVTVWAGYNKPVQFPIEFERLDSAAPARLRADIFIGICEKICVPFQTSMSVNIVDATASNADQLAVQSAFDALPPLASEKFGVKTMKAEAQLLRIETVLDAPNTMPELFLAAPRGWQFAAPKLLEVQGTTAHFEAEILFAPKESQDGAQVVTYTLENGGKAVSGSVNLLK
jgi:DsbC/DsbD-like thiol-disulfide interchange protein